MNEILGYDCQGQELRAGDVCIVVNAHPGLHAVLGLSATIEGISNIFVDHVQFSGPACAAARQIVGLVSDPTSGPPHYFLRIGREMTDDALEETRLMREGERLAREHIERLARETSMTPVPDFKEG